MWQIMREADGAAGFYWSLKESYVKNRQAPWKAEEQCWAACRGRGWDILKGWWYKGNCTGNSTWSQDCLFGESNYGWEKRLAWAGKREHWGTGRDVAARSGAAGVLPCSSAEASPSTRDRQLTPLLTETQNSKVWFFFKWWIYLNKL